MRRHIEESEREYRADVEPKKIIFDALFRGDCSLEARGIDAMTPDCKNWWTPTAQYYYKQASRCPTTEPPELGEDYAFIPNLNIDSDFLHVLAATSASYEALRVFPRRREIACCPRSTIQQNNCSLW
ncbi:uncharacterized protein LOC119185211 isoform X2 [Rhipicephalus microplus]|uniref:uncharacterized protein LOC119185211 isoform X2 n=1 Tax=Rhipicephalus microplus TaxID=6941 RepID=UPI003F6B7BF0